MTISKSTLSILGAISLAIAAIYGTPSHAEGQSNPECAAFVVPTVSYNKKTNGYSDVQSLALPDGFSAVGGGGYGNVNVVVACK